LPFLLLIRCIGRRKCKSDITERVLMKMVAIVSRIRKDGTYSEVGVNDRFLTHSYKTVKGLIRYGINAQWANENINGGLVRIQIWCSTLSMFRNDTPKTYFIEKY
jgi:hypothetical protein